MDDPRVLKIITVGLVLAAIAVGYFLWSGRFAGNTATKNANTNANRIVQSSPTPTPLPVVSVTPSPTPATLGAVSGNGVSALPATGSPLFLLGAISASAVTAGFYLRKFKG